MAKPTTPLPASLQADMTARSHQAMRQRFEQPAVAKPRPRADFWRTLENRLRRATDIAVAGSALLLLSPLLLRSSSRTAAIWCIRNCASASAAACSACTSCAR